MAAGRKAASQCTTELWALHRLSMNLNAFVSYVLNFYVKKESDIYIAGIELRSAQLASVLSRSCYGLSMKCSCDGLSMAVFVWLEHEVLTSWLEHTSFCYELSRK